MSGWATTFTWKCDLVDDTSSPQALRVSQYIVVPGLCLIMLKCKESLKLKKKTFFISTLYVGEKLRTFEYHTNSGNF